MGHAARTVPTTRDPVIRNAWVKSVVDTQRDTIKVQPAPIVPGAVVIDTPEKEPPEPENSLLVFRYEETVPTPEETLAKRSEECLARIEEAKRMEEQSFKKRKPVYVGDDSDDERLVIDDLMSPQVPPLDKCPYCDFTTPHRFSMQCHILRHYNLKPFMCPHCDFTGHNKTVSKHQAAMHIGHVLSPVRVPIPKGKPTVFDLDAPKSVRPKARYQCLLCDKSLLEDQMSSHVHVHREPQFGKPGDDVLKCRHCGAVRQTLTGMRAHHAVHTDLEMSYIVAKLVGKLICKAARCYKQFGNLSALKMHHAAKHAPAPLQYDGLAPAGDPVEEPTELSDDDERPPGGKRRFDEAFQAAPKRIAKKSTTRLPFSNRVAKKSTSKLPFWIYEDTSESEPDEEYSYYGTRPPPMNNYSSVTTFVPFLNTVMPFTLNKLSEFVNINPKVQVKDVAKS